MCLKERVQRSRGCCCTLLSSCFQSAAKVETELPLCAGPQTLHAPVFIPCTAGMKEDVQLYSERMRKAERLQQAEQKVRI